MTKLRDGSLNIYAKGLFHAPPDDAKLMSIELLQLREQTRWIPVEEPPELTQDVICCSVAEPDCGAYPGYYAHDRGEFYDFNDELLFPKPTHYRLISHDLPLPPAPEVEK
jgi:hypothetical protein